MRLIPGKTKVQIELFKGVSLADMLVGGVGVLLFVFVLASTLPGKFIWMCGIVFITGMLLLRIDTEPNYLYLLHMLQHYSSKRKYTGNKNNGKAGGVSEIIPFTDIKDGYINYNGEYYGAVIEISPTEFRFFSNNRRTNSVENGVGRALRSVASDYSVNIVKLERPMVYDVQMKNEQDKLEALKKSFENGVLTEEELVARAEIVHSRIDQLKDLCFDNKILGMFYYIVMFDSDKGQLGLTVQNALDTLRAGEIKARRLDDAETAVFLRYTNDVDFDEREIKNVAPEEYAAWAMPTDITITPRTVEVNNIITHNLRVVNYPTEVGDGWLASVMSLPGTKVVVKAKPADRQKSVRNIDRALTELRGQYASTGVDSKRIELQSHIESLSELLNTLQGDNETLMDTNIYITAYDYQRTKTIKGAKAPESVRSLIGNMKRTVRRTWSEANMRLNNMEFCQQDALIGSQISAYDPMIKKGRGMPSNTVAASYPWVFSYINDSKGVMLGTSDGMPVFVDFFRRDNERVNSNMVIVGKSGSGKSYAAKSILSNLAADDSKVFILDPENEYSELAANLHGKYINVGNAKFGRLNPFHVITALDDDMGDGGSNGGSYATHLQFLEEFYRQILPDCDKEAMEYLNSLTDRMYTNKGINGDTDLSKLRPGDYPTFDDLYETLLGEFQHTDNVYIRTILRSLMNYISKFSTGGRNSQIWNGPSTITTEENFTVFNFQSLLANRNGTIANAQMLLVLKYIDNEIIKNRDYNIKYKANRKVVVVIDEAHVFIDTKYPAALDFMYQLAKRIRKYNGMQIVITQNIKDFVGSEEIARKSTAIINACQYSFIFPLAPNDMSDLCKLYEKAGGINENEQEQIVGAPRGTAFTVMSSQSRSTVHVEVPQNVIHLFKDKEYKGEWSAGEEGKARVDEYIGQSRPLFEQNRKSQTAENTEAESGENEKKEGFTFVKFEEFSEEEAEKAYGEPKEKKEKRGAVEFTELTDDDIPEIPEDPEEFKKMQAAKAKAASASGEEFISREDYVEGDGYIPAYIPRETKTVVEVSSSKTEELLSELVGRLSMDSIREEIRRAVDSEFASRKVPTETLTVETVTEKIPEENTDFEMPDFDTDSTVVADETDNTATEAIFAVKSGTEDYTAADTAAGDDGAMDDDSDDDDDLFGFSVADLLRSQVDSYVGVNVIDMMKEYGQTVIEITLDDLVQYTKKAS